MIITLMMFSFLAGEDATFSAFEPALQQAKKENKLLLVDFYAVWCGPCKEFSRDSHNKPEIETRLAQVILTKIDAEKGDGIKWAQTYNVQGYPTYCLISPQGELVDQWSGYGFQDFQTRFDRAIANPTTVAQKIAQFEKKATPEMAEYLGDLHMELGDSQKSRQYYAIAEKMGVQSYNMLGSLFRLDFDEFGNGNQEVLPGLIQKATKLLHAGESFPDGPQYVGALIDKMIPEQDLRPQTTDLVNQFNQWIQQNPDRISEKKKKVFLADFQWLVEKDDQAALASRSSIMGDGWQEDGNALNEMAWWCFERQLFLDQAITWAKKGIEITEPGPDRANIWDTLAEVQFLKGDQKGAIESESKAVEESPNRKFFQKQLERFKQNDDPHKSGSTP